MMFSYFDSRESKLVVLTLLGKDEQAIFLVRQRKHPYQQLEGLLAVFYAQSEQHRANTHLLDEALANADVLLKQNLVDPSVEFAFSVLAETLVTVGNVEKAIEIARILSPDWKFPTLLAVADHWIGRSPELALSLAEEALAIARTESQACLWDFPSNLAAFAVVIAKLGHDGIPFIMEALNIARSLPSSKRRAEALYTIAEAMSKLGLNDARVVYVEAFVAANSEACDYCRAYAIWQVLDSLAEAGFLEDALQLASHSEPAIVNWAVQCLASMGRIEEAQRLIQLSLAKDADFSRDYIAYLARVGRFDEALVIAREDKTKWMAFKLKPIAVAMARAGLSDALKVIEEIEAIQHNQR